MSARPLRLFVLIGLGLGAAPAKALTQGDLPLYDHPAREQTLAPSDDPTTGLGAEAFFGLFLLTSSKGALADAHWGGGARACWDFGRLLADPTLHEALFADLTWAWTGYSGGDSAVHTSTTYHYFTLAPAFEIPFGEGSAYGFYAQLGGGMAVESSALSAARSLTTSGVVGLFQYGIGIRGRPLLSDDGTLRLTFRIEATRYRRGYLDDTLVLASAGLAF
jgi:hypothetical protein